MHAQNALLGGHAQAEREAVVTRPPVHVEPVAPARPEPVVGHVSTKRRRNVQGGRGSRGRAARRACGRRAPGPPRPPAGGGTRPGRAAARAAARPAPRGCARRRRPSARAGGCLRKSIPTICTGPASVSTRRRVVHEQRDACSRRARARRAPAPRGRGCRGRRRRGRGSRAAARAPRQVRAPIACDSMVRKSPVRSTRSGSCATARSRRSGAGASTDMKGPRCGSVICTIAQRPMLPRLSVLVRRDPRRLLRPADDEVDSLFTSHERLKEPDGPHRVGQPRRPGIEAERLRERPREREQRSGHEGRRRPANDQPENERPHTRTREHGEVHVYEDVKDGEDLQRWHRETSRRHREREQGVDAQEDGRPDGERAPTKERRREHDTEPPAECEEPKPRHELTSLVDRQSFVRMLERACGCHPDHR